MQMSTYDKIPAFMNKLFSKEFLFQLKIDQLA